MDRQLALFRLGMLGSFIGAIVAFTQFDIAASAMALWNQNPTTQEDTKSDLLEETTLANCHAKETPREAVEDPLHCYPNLASKEGLPRDTAVANIQGFLLAASMTFLIVLTDVLLGYRIARENQLGRN